jgi:hypothetical protein
MSNEGRSVGESLGERLDASPGPTVKKREVDAAVVVPPLEVDPVCPVSMALPHVVEVIVRYIMVKPRSTTPRNRVGGRGRPIHTDVDGMIPMDATEVTKG